MEPIKNMKLHQTKHFNFIIFIVMVLSIIFFSCNDGITNEEYEVKYEVISLNGLPVAEFMEVEDYYCDYPRAFLFKDVSEVQGEIELEFLGIKKIDLISEDKTSFGIDLQDELYPPVRGIAFKDLEIIADTFRCRYNCYGEELDYSPVEVIAVSN